MANAKWETALQYASIQNVLLTLTVHEIRLASHRNAETHASVPVELIRCVRRWTTSLSARVRLDSLATLVYSAPFQRLKVNCRSIVNYFHNLNIVQRWKINRHSDFIIEKLSNPPEWSVFYCQTKEIFVTKKEKNWYLRLIYFSEPIPECIQNSECSNDKTCYNQRCVDPCTLDSCGFNSRCHVQMHRAVCVCNEGFTGNPQQYCGESTSCKYFWSIISIFHAILYYQCNKYHFHLFCVFIYVKVFHIFC